MLTECPLEPPISFLNKISSFQQCSSISQKPFTSDHILSLPRCTFIRAKGLQHFPSQIRSASNLDTKTSTKQTTRGERLKKRFNYLRALKANDISINLIWCSIFHLFDTTISQPVPNHFETKTLINRSLCEREIERGRERKKVIRH